jgi:hypothetical protein
MAEDWQALTALTGGRDMIVERVRIAGSDVHIEGEFDLPPLASLSAQDQAFVSAFVSCHGSIKQMEKWLGVSYPTIKSRLNRLAGQIGFVEQAPDERQLLFPLDDDCFSRLVASA